MYATHVSTICRTLKSMGCTRQVIQRIALQCSNKQRANLCQEYHTHYPSMFLWIDESGCDLQICMRKCGYSLQGMKCRDHPLLIWGNRYSAIHNVPVMSLDGIHDVYLVEANVFGDKFETFIQNCVLPVLQPFNWTNPYSVVIMDNASIGHIDAISDLIEGQAGARLLSFSPHSHDLNPVEEVFSRHYEENWLTFSS